VCTEHEHENDFKLDNRDKKITKNSDSWRSSFVSNVPLYDDTFFFEICFNYYDDDTLDGLFVGVTDAPKTRISSSSYPIDTERTCAVYNNDIGLHGQNRSVRIAVSCETASGDVLGVLVDRKNDKILFYKNGEQVAEGLKKPSDLKRPLYAFTTLFYSGSCLEIVEKFKFQNLKRS
jgi:hypothetical protein